jgi:hypothetical protein
LTLPVHIPMAIEISAGPGAPPIVTIDATVEGVIVAYGIAPTAVTGRRTFYAGSEYETGLGDRASAIATDKVAYIPTGSNSAGINNVTSYVHGITGIMVELTGAHGTLTAADFTVKMSEQYVDVFNTPPSAWQAAPAFTLSTVNNTPGSGTTRYELVWANGVAPKNRYIEVIVEGNDALGGNNTNTGLAASDTFFFGNLVGESFNTFLADGYFAVEASDEVATRFNQGSAVDLSFITNKYDYNRDLVVDSSDQIIARFNQNFLVAFSTTNPPAAPLGGDGSGAAVASALALTSGVSPGAASAPVAALLPEDVPEGWPPMAAGAPLVERVALALSVAEADGEPLVGEELLELLAGGD